MHDRATWRRSSYCGSGTCVEVATTQATALIRDGKDPQSPVLVFSGISWTKFLAHLNDGELTHKN